MEEEGNELRDAAEEQIKTGEARIKKKENGDIINRTWDMDIICRDAKSRQ